MTWRLEDEWRPSKLQHYWEQPEYWEESWRLEETCCHSVSREKPSSKIDVKNSQRVNNNKNKTKQKTYKNKHGTVFFRKLCEIKKNVHFLCLCVHDSFKQLTLPPETVFLLFFLTIFTSVHLYLCPLCRL